MPYFSYTQQAHSVLLLTYINAAIHGETAMKKRVMIKECSALHFNNVPLSKSHRRGGSSGSRVEVQSKSFPEASGPSLALLTRLDLRKENNQDPKSRMHRCGACSWMNTVSHAGEHSQQS